ncbi:RING finger protein 141-like [Metopolophium dirhodum]|uniref:RING finger protein 141-like n=1 Tax=Metopolophium dirhodum TaxID=44670 RepID=UPI0029900F5D|nr:RING finger protein 141-like [Metopolophium dirhodum]
MNQGQGPAINNCRARDSSRECCCIICYDKCVCVKLSPCEHKFCSACVVKMTEQNINNCPICRRQVNQISHIDPMSID